MNIGKYIEREDECCGFGGTFSVFEPGVSVKMGKERIADHETNGAEVITATDMSCLMHLEGIIRRQKKNIRVVHVAETGTVVVCTNEGNADMGIHAAPVQVHCMGIEKIIPKTTDLGIFTRLLARSATGQAITTYTSHYRKPGPGSQMHIVIVDNGRSKILADKNHHNSLKCIRCGACMNTCPVYRRSGGHSYGSVIPGPIGSILSPSQNLKLHKDLPFASSLCGSCSDVCPVKIDIHSQLYRWRQEIAEQKQLPASKSMMMTVAGKILASNTLYIRAGRIARWSLRNLPRPFMYNSLNIWGRDRELPKPARQSFKEWYRINKKGE